MKITILIDLLPSDHTGGAELQTVRIAEELSKKHEVKIISRSVSKRKDENYPFKIQRVRVIRFPFLRGISGIFSTLKAIKQTKQDVLLCMKTAPNGLIGVIAKKLYRIPAAVWIRGEGEFNLRKFLGNEKSLFSPSILYQILNRFVFKNANVIIAQTNQLRNKLLQVIGKKYANKIYVIPNGIDIPGKVANGNKIVFAGRLVTLKGVDYLINAVKNTKKKLIIIGSGPEETILKKLAAKSKNIEFFGKLSHDTLLQSMLKGKIFVLPSTNAEGLPNVVLEAMSIGLPIIATKVGGVPDIIEDSKTGLLIDPKSLSALRESILHLSKDHNLRKEMSKNCLEEIKKYSWNNITPKIEETLNKTIEKYNNK